MESDKDIPNKEITIKICRICKTTLIYRMLHVCFMVAYIIW